MSAQQVAAELERDDAPLLLDVREPWEAEIASIPGSVLIPLGELGERAAELRDAASVIAYCHHGVRSARALDLLEAAGITGGRHLAGGIDAWSRTVDPSLIGGIVLQIGSHRADGSVRGRLERLRHELATTR